MLLGQFQLRLWCLKLLKDTLPQIPHSPSQQLTESTIEHLPILLIEYIKIGSNQKRKSSNFCWVAKVVLGLTKLVDFIVGSFAYMLRFVNRFVFAKKNGSQF